MSKDHNEKSQVLNLYALFGVSIVMSILPYASAQLLSLIFFALLMVMTYRLRRMSEAHSLGDNHATYLIRSFWISALISVITMIAASIYVFMSVDPAPFHPCAMALINQAESLAQSGDTAQIMALGKPCMPAFLDANKGALMIAGGVVIAPLMGYIAYRFIAGIQRAIKGYRIADPLKWL